MLSDLSSMMAISLKYCGFLNADSSDIYHAALKFFFAILISLINLFEIVNEYLCNSILIKKNLSFSANLQKNSAYCPKKEGDDFNCVETPVIVEESRERNKLLKVSQRVCVH